MSGVLLVDKPVGPSSHQVVARIRKALQQRRVGHAGTLDPAASGLLVVGVGAGTRLLTFLVGLDKTYEATIRLGVGTVTDDAEGDVTSAPGCSDAVDVPAALEQFRGPLRQRPSAVSAIKVDGRRAYQRVRSGEDVHLPARDVTVHRLELTDTRADTTPDGVAVLDVDVTMSVTTGTYVRAIARDLGQSLGSAGHLTALRRTAVGPFQVASAVALDDVGPTTTLLGLGAVASQVLPSFVVGDDDLAAVANGTRLPCHDGLGKPTALLTSGGRLLSVASCTDGRWRHHMVVPSATLESP